MSRNPRQLNAQIDQLLNDARPDKYDVNNPAETAWIDTIVVPQVRALLDPDEVLDQLAHDRVHARNKGATKASNKLFRLIEKNGTLPLFWSESEDWPVSVVDHDKDGNRVEQRVRIGAATVQDLRLYAAEERRRAAEDFTARNEACRGAEKIANGAAIAGIQRAWDYMKTLDVEGEQ